MGTDTMLEADIIIAGGTPVLDRSIILRSLVRIDRHIAGGTSACVLAGRLAAAAPALQILLLEAGAHTRDVLAHVQPGRFATHLLPGSTTIKYYVGTASAHLAGCAPVVPCGQCVGGGSSVNCEWPVSALGAGPAEADGFVGLCVGSHDVCAPGSVGL